jgi:predicted nucleic acid-binding protein
LIYLDSCLAIYLVERDEVWESQVHALMESHADEIFATSPLVELECLVAPLRTGNAGLVEEFRSFLAQLVLIDIPGQAYARAAYLRALHGLKTPDALHLATARLAGCSALWTNDDRLAKAAPGFALSVRHLLAC